MSSVEPTLTYDTLHGKAIGFVLIVLVHAIPAFLILMVYYILCWLFV